MYVTKGQDSLLGKDIAIALGILRIDPDGDHPGHVHHARAPRGPNQEPEKIHPNSASEGGPQEAQMVQGTRSHRRAAAPPVSEKGGSPTWVITKKTWDSEEVWINIDTKCMNDQLVPTKIPIRTPKELRHKLEGSGWLAAIDCPYSYFHFILDPVSQDLFKFHSEDGVYHFKVLDMGTPSASEKCHAAISYNLKGVVQIKDNIIIHGNGQEHDDNLRACLKRLYEYCIRLRKENRSWATFSESKACPLTRQRSTKSRRGPLHRAKTRSNHSCRPCNLWPATCVARRARHMRTSWRRSECGRDSTQGLCELRTARKCLRNSKGGFWTKRSLSHMCHTWTCDCMSTMGQPTLHSPWCSSTPTIKPRDGKRSTTKAGA